MSFDENALEERLSRPTVAAINAVKNLDQDIVLLGVGGKMGPSLARMMKRCCEELGKKQRVIGVARFSDPKVRQQLEEAHVETIAADLLDERQLQELPDAGHVLYMTGMKFGSTGQAWMTWGMNCLLPSLVCRRYPKSQIVAFSSGNIYGLIPVNHGGSKETDGLDPVGEYAMTCVGRERIFEYYSRQLAIPTAIIRLNYACDLRYGVLVDLAWQVHSESPIRLGMGYFNTIWQGDANALTIASFSKVSTPPYVVNLSGIDTLSVRATAERMAHTMNKKVHFIDSESDTALLTNTSKCTAEIGKPEIGSDELIDWVCNWVMKGGRNLQKPTHFESRDGKF